MPALSIAALGRSKACCAARWPAGWPSQDGLRPGLVAQGLGNIVIPFFGGVPATAAIARTSVAIKSGGVTRVMSLVHSAALLLAALVLAPVISRVPLAALAGVLVVTAWRKNEWHEIREIFRRRFKSAIIAFVSTLIATVALDLTQAIVMGIGLSALIFVVQISRIKVALAMVSVEKMRADGYEMQYDANRILVVYIMGPLFFGTVNTFNTLLEKTNGNQDIILSLRTVPLLDTTGLGAIETLIHHLEGEGRRVYLSGLSEPVRSYLERAGIIRHLGRIGSSGAPTRPSLLPTASGRRHFASARRGSIRRCSPRNIGANWRRIEAGERQTPLPRLLIQRLTARSGRRRCCRLPARCSDRPCRRAARPSPAARRAASGSGWPTRWPGGRRSDRRRSRPGGLPGRT